MQENLANAKLFNSSVHCVDGNPVNWLPVPPQIVSHRNTRQLSAAYTALVQESSEVEALLQRDQRPVCLLQHLLNDSRFYVPRVLSYTPSTCSWRVRREYCIKTVDKEATLYNVVEESQVDGALKTKSNWLTGTCQLPDGSLKAAFQLRRVRSFPLFAADLVPLPIWTSCIEVVQPGSGAAASAAAAVSGAHTDPDSGIVGQVRSAWGPVKGFWLSDRRNVKRYQIKSERLMQLCFYEDASGDDEPLEVFQGDTVCCVATIHWPRYLRTVYCDSGAMDVCFTESATDMTAKDRLLVLCGLIYAWEQIG